MAERRRTQDVARKDNAKRTLMWLFAFIIMLTGALGYGVWKRDASWTPALGLDLEGGFQFILSPRSTDGGSVSQQQLEEARDIIVQRIDAQGTSGAEVTTQGSSNIVVAMPGVPTKEQQDAIAASSQMQFRPVLATDIGDPEAAQPQPSASSSSGSGSSGSGSSSSSSSSAQPSASRSSSTPASRNQERTAEPTPSSSGSGSGTSSPSSSASAPSSSSTAAPTGTDPSADSWKPTGEPTSATDPNHISTKLWREFQDLNCAKPPEDQPVGKTDEAIVACKDDGSLKYVLGPVVVAGTEIADAEAGYRVGPQGQQTNEPEIQLTLTSKGRKEYGDVSKQMVKLPGLNPASPTNPPGSYNALAAVLDSKVLIDPGFNEAIPNGQASISGFSIDEARSLAKSLKFGALPLSFDVQSRQEISPTLGSEQLRYGIIAGLIGLFVVLLYALLQYRALSVVVIGSMLVAFGITYLAIALLAWGYNYRLDMAGVTGLIIAIGVTADSFIVYFERVRDELREGRNLRAAVEAGWARAKGTILVADGVNLIAAVVLYVLASSGVRGFAFTLGLTTLIDLAIFWLFTHPLLTILARNKFFASGHKWSGFDVDTLREAKVRYKGRGNFDIDNPVAVPAEGGAR
ncbi:protein translocase subunit SecD [Janibacter sp. YB324]|uniref:protein translocase subunit SecD n=1 Tax=Janibacter sp. YB324 TaxID=2761047 RepID=UPI0016277B91|nr:protein translocase subunit SecD [Janibacter sp. YB324]QNF95548.1 protein translocase subunit SecD [Janibacter sp. YB324]